MKEVPEESLSLLPIARGCLWFEAQLKQIKDSCQAIWESDHEIVWTEREIALWEDCTSFKVNKMTVRTNQLLWIKGATDSKIHTQESEAKVHGRKKTLMQSLNQFHACFYQLYEKGMTWAMVSLKGLFMSDAFRYSNVSASMGLKSFCPWCLKLGGNTEMIAIHLRELYYRMVIVCNICQSFTSMNAQSILDHHSGYKAKYDKECTKQEDQEKAKKSHIKKSKSWGWEEAS